MKKEEELTKIKMIVERIIDNLRVKAKVRVKDEEGLVLVQLKTKEPGILIGYHGRNLDAFQWMTSLIVYRQLGRWLRILVDVNHYRAERERVLKQMARGWAQKVKTSGKPQVLLPMSSFERRVIHLALANDPEIETVSEGREGKRRVIIKART